jgi:hypothetical protein
MDIHKDVVMETGLNSPGISGEPLQALHSNFGLNKY